MNIAWNQRLDDDELDVRVARGRARVQELMSVLTLTAQRRSVAEIAEQLGRGRDFVRWAQHALRLQTAGLDGGRRGEGLGRWPLEPPS